MLFRMKFKNGNSALIRCPKPGATTFPEEKVRNKVDVLGYNTAIPVPTILD